MYLYIEERNVVNKIRKRKKNEHRQQQTWEPVALLTVLNTSYKTEEISRVLMSFCLFGQNPEVISTTETDKIPIVQI